MSDQPNKIYAAMSGVMAEIGAIAKAGENRAQGFKFRGIDDVYNAVHGAMIKHQVFCIPRVLTRTETIGETKQGSKSFRVILEMEFDFATIDGSIVTVGPIFGEAMDTSDKATNKANSACHKYAFLMTFAIPTRDLEDADHDSPEEIGPFMQRLRPAIPPPSPSTTGGLTDAQIKRIFAIGRGKNWTDETLHKLLSTVSKGTVKSLKDLTKSQYEKFVTEIQTSTPEERLKGQDQ